MKVLITGANGLLGQKIVRYCLDKNVDFIATSKGENRNGQCPDDRYRPMDITDEEGVNTVLAELNPKYVIHTAAMTMVDQCENEPEVCREINVTATAYLFEASKKIGAHFQLLSTDFVFDGEQGNYKEEDEINPLSVYAQSKADAEEILKSDNYKNWSIVRTIIVYGQGENLSRSNIVLWAKSALEKGGPLTIVDDQFRAPTWAEDLAAGCMAVVEHDEKGIFHICGPETMSIFTLVERIARHFGYDFSKVERISSTTLNQAAKRPPKTGFDLTKSRERLGYNPHTIEETLDVLFAPKHA